MRLVLILTLALLCPAAHAQLVQLIPDIDRLAAEPGAEVKRNARGAVEAVTLRRNGVVINAMRQGDKVQSIGQDQSGHGAVLCSWGIYVGAKVALDVCFPGQYPQLRQELDDAINRINGFIAANSLVPISVQALVAAIAAKETAARAQVGVPGSEHLAQACAASSAPQMIGGLARQSHADWQKALAELTSVPRPPVMNPCM